ELLPEMRQRKQGRIINVSSIGGKVAVPHLLPYVASKFALTGFSTGLRIELTGTGVVVTTVCPGMMRTGSHVNARYTGNDDRGDGDKTLVAGHHSRGALPEWVTTLPDEASEQNNEMLGRRRPEATPATA